jgi:hypothetical protein
MTFRRLFLFVEVDDDERFFRSVLLPSLRTAYEDIQFVQFSRLKKEKVRGFLQSIAGMKADYIFVRDLDRLPCATAARDKMLAVFPQVSADRVQIVKAEIESWYCAGLPEGHPWESLASRPHLDTSTVTKEAFEAAILRKGAPRVSTMLEILESFDREAAVRRNESFRRFVRRFITPLGPSHARGL